MESNDVVLGVVALVAGLLFCFAGARILRAAITVWGAFLGFAVGMQLDGSARWIVAIVLAAVFAALAYLYYVFAVVVGIGSLGYGAALAAMQAADWGSDGVRVAIGLAAGVVVGLAALALHLPTLLLVVATAISGASVLVAGAGVLLTAWTVREVETGSAAHFGWITLAVTVVGVLVQSRSHGTAASTREGWS